MADPEANSVPNQSGGVDVNAQRVDVGHDVVGRDKIESAGGHIVHAEAGATIIIGEHPTSAPQDLSSAPGEPPFKGLQYFDITDADLFFGRELLTAKIAGLLREQRFLAIVGASGSGKSSVVRAGLIPALKHGEQLADGTLPPAGSSRWLMHVITPTAHPLEALAASLTQDSESVSATATLMDDIDRDPRSLHLAVRRVLSRTPANRLVLVVDQFEELFTLCRSDNERKAFVDNLMRAAAPETAGPTVVVITLRADFYAHCGQFDNLRKALEQWQAYIGSMCIDELRRAIEEPAKRNGWEFEAGLIDLMLRDAGAGDEPGALPLLSHALLETWRNRRGRMLTLAGYDESGGVHGAIAKTAESVFNQLKPEQQVIARNIFLRLTELGEGTQDTRRRASLSELILRPEDKPAIETVIKTLADARLVITKQDTAEVAHEALIREWPTLRKWLSENREGLRIHRQMSEDAQDWATLRGDVGTLYRGARLAAASEWAKDHSTEMNPLELEFLKASRALQVSELEAAKQRAEEQTRTAARLRRQARYLIGAFVVAMGLGIAAVIFGVQSNTQQRLSRSRELAAEANNQLEVDPDRSILIALEANSGTHTFETEDALRRALYASRTVATLRGHVGAVYDAQFSPDGKWIVTSGDSTARVWETATGHEIATLRGHEGAVGDAQFSPDGKWIVTSGDSTARLWEAATGKAVAILRGHGGWVNNAQFSLDGKWIVTASKDKTARVWDVATGQEVATLRGHEDSVGDAQFSPDGKWIVTASEDKTARVWDGATGQEVATLRGHDSRVLHAQFSPDSKWIVTGSFDKMARVWEAATGKEVATLRGHEDGILSAQFSPDGKWIVTASADNTARVWESVTGKEVATLRGHASLVTHAQFSPDGKWIVTASYDGTARMWEAVTGHEIAILRGHEDTVLSAQFSHNGKWIVTASEDKTARVWAATTGHEIATLGGHESTVRNARFSPDGQWIVTASDDRTARIWETATGKEVAVLRGHEDRVNNAEFSPDGQWIVTASGDSTARVWEVATGKEVAVLRGHEKWVYDAQFSPDGKWIVTASGDSTARVWEVATGKEVATLGGHEGTVLSAQFSLDGKWIATASDDGTARVWETATGKEVAVLRGHRDRVYHAQFSPDGKWIVTASAGGTARVWAATTGLEVAMLRGHEDPVYDAQFSSDGKWIVTAGVDKTARVWEVATGKQVAILRGHEGAVYDAQFSSNSKWIVTASYDRTARVWEVATGKEVATLRGHEDAVYDAQFSPDGKWIITASVDKTARVYVVNIEDLVTLAKTRVTRELTCDERVKYLHEDMVCATSTQ